MMTSLFRRMSTHLPSATVVATVLALETKIGVNPLRPQPVVLILRVQDPATLIGVRRGGMKGGIRVGASETMLPLQDPAQVENGIRHILATSGHLTRQVHRRHGQGHRLIMIPALDIPGLMRMLHIIGEALVRNPLDQGRVPKMSGMLGPHQCEFLVHQGVAQLYLPTTKKV